MTHTCTIPTKFDAQLKPPQMVSWSNFVCASLWAGLLLIVVFQKRTLDQKIHSYEIKCWTYTFLIYFDIFSNNFDFLIIKTLSYNLNFLFNNKPFYLITDFYLIILTF